MEHDGKVWTIDHRRLVAARRAGVNIRYVKDDSAEAKDALVDRLRTSKTDGLSIRESFTDKEE